MIKKLLSYMGEYKKWILLAPVLMVAEVLCEIVMPRLMAAIVDVGIANGDMGAIVRNGIYMLVLAVIGMITGVLSARVATKGGQGFGSNLRNAMFQKIQDFSFADIDRFSSASLITRTTNDVNQIQMTLTMATRMVVRVITMLTGALFMAFSINAELARVLLVAIPVLMVGIGIVMKLSNKLFGLMQEKLDNLNNTVQENLVAIRVVKAFVREDYENEKFGKAATKLYDLFVSAEKLQALNLPVMMFIVYGCIIAISWFGARFIAAGSMTTGNLTSLFTYVMTAFSSLMMLSMIFVMMTMSAASGKRIAEVLEEKADITDPAKPLDRVKDGSIDFDHVTFSYRQGSGENTLNDIDLHIRSGETIGIIGGTGCGKSSLVSLISRLYDVTSGSVKVGGEDVRSYNLETLRNQVAVVLQKNVLFSGTVLDNLRWGKKMGSTEEYREACRLACADEFIEHLPKGYDAWVERGGANFSGGQKQRLCIARALLKHPKVLILDDSTSAVDTATDARIREALQTVIPGTTKIIIAQRISSVQDADRILVLDNGGASGFDTHENLLKTNTIYQEIYEAQTKGGGDFDHA